MLYHGVRQTASGSLYRLGLALLDLARPDQCLLRGDMWMFGPEAPYEREGDVGNVAFPCGYTIGDDGDTVYLYYGAADTSWRWPREASARCSTGWTSTALPSRSRWRYGWDRRFPSRSRCRADGPLDRNPESLIHIKL